MINKRGISNIVVTLLLVLLALGAVMLLWGLVSNLLEDSSGKIQVTTACLDLNLEPVGCRYNITSNESRLRYKRGAGETVLDLAKVLLVLEFEDGSSSPIEVSGENVPSFLETKFYVTGSFSSAPDKLSVAGVLTTAEGEEKTCVESPISIKCNPL